MGFGGIEERFGDVVDCFHEKVFVFFIGFDCGRGAFCRALRADGFNGSTRRGGETGGCGFDDTPSGCAVQTGACNGVGE